MKKLTLGFASLAQVILLTAMGWNLSFNARAQTNLIFDTETKLAPNGPRQLMFGIDVAINGFTAAVGALLPPFDANGGVYIGTQILTSGKGFDSFGKSVALSSNVLVVGQPSTSLSNLSGEVYVFTNAGTTWSLEQKLIEEGSPLDGFGSAVGISGQTLVASNPFESSDANASGALYVYQKIGTTWFLQAKLKASDPTNNQFLGISVAIDGDKILAGANNLERGAVYVFVRNGTNWTQQQILAPADLQDGAHFGASVALEGNVAVVGAPSQAVSGPPGGTVYIFVRNGTNWVLQTELNPVGAANLLSFGAAVAIHNGIIAVGLPGRAVDGILFAGAVDIFQFDGTNVVAAQEVSATDAHSGALLGASVDFGDLGIIAGAPGDFEVGREATGAAYIFSASATNPPVIPIASASPNVLFPPNHKLVPVTIAVANHDSFNSCRIISVTSSEPITGKGSGKTSPDFIITGDLTLQLRAERSGNAKAGRIYTIQVACTDVAGNTTSTTVLVTVPKDNRNSSVALPISPRPAAPKAVKLK